MGIHEVSWDFGVRSVKSASKYLVMHSDQKYGCDSLLCLMTHLQIGQTRLSVTCLHRSFPVSIRELHAEPCELHNKIDQIQLILLRLKSDGDVNGMSSGSTRYQMAGGL